MGNKKVDTIVFRLSLVIFLLAIFCFFITERKSRERIVIYFTLIISAITFIISIVKIKKK
jgi:hypothetical protein